MARMHARRKGKSGSKKPIDTKNVWLRYGAKEIELLIQKLAKRGTTASVIGMKLRDTYGIPDVKKITKKSISEILTKHKLAPPLPQDLIDLIKKDITLSSHRETNKKDMTAKRGTTLTESKINRLVKYYKSTGKLKPDWQYRRDQARLLIS
ncbi:30S ribosomal protein S15 [archaeon]|nr:30S ribosomal protein S15 [archaeon]|tara:strand:+ start:949 stop:1401 length:453 start_codon:yes stop_codon:yes gene_type:complete